MVFVKGGRENTGLDAIEWAKRGEELEQELVVNSMDSDGVKNGFDKELLEAISKVVTIPIIASGGAGNMEHFKDVFEVKGVDAGLLRLLFFISERLRFPS